MKRLLIMKKLYFFFFLFFVNHLHAQSPDARWSVGVNPLSVVESMASIGPAISYRLSPRVAIWAEGSYIFSNLYAYDSWKNLQGYRFEFQPRWYTGTRKLFFIALEYRLKHFTYNTSGTFINKAIADTLNDYSYKGSQVLSGGAFVIGKQVNISHRLFLEITLGIGSKKRVITSKNIPAGYNLYEPERRQAFTLSYNENNVNEVYVPLGFRLMWRLH